MYYRPKPILGRSLRNALGKRIPNAEFNLKTVTINGEKQGVTGFISNPENENLIYVSTDVYTPAGYDTGWILVRFARDQKDFRGGTNHHCKTLAEFAAEAEKMLKAAPETITVELALG